MKRLAFLVLIVMVAAMPAAAQPATPWPTQPAFPTATPGRQPVATPGPNATPGIIVPNDDISAGLNAIPTITGIDLDSPGGQPVLPEANLVILFSYAKWMLAFSSAEEYAGPFAPIVQHLGIGVFLAVALGAVLITVWVAMYLIRFAVWLLLLIIRLIDFVAGMFSRAVELFTP
jgi:hypothetical protein